VYVVLKCVKKIKIVLKIYLGVGVHQRLALEEIDGWFDTQSVTENRL